MTIKDSIDAELDKLPPEASGAFIKLTAEGDLHSQSASLVLEKKNEHWDIKAGIGLEHVAAKPIDVQFKASIEWAW